MNAKSDPYALGIALSAAGKHAEAIERFEEALAHNPRDIRALFALGTTADALGMAKPAEAFYREVLALEPSRLEALVNLGNLLRATGQFGAAEAVLAPALARDQTAPELWLTLGSIYREMGDRPRALSYYREALKLRPDYVPALANLADLLPDDGHNAEAFALYDRAIALEPKNAQARLNRATLHLLCGHLEDGWRDYAARLEMVGHTPQPDRDIPRWNGESLTGKRLLVSAEQGVGDQLMFASLVPELAERATREGGQVILECEKRLVPLFARSFPTVRVRPSRHETRAGVVTARYDWLSAEGDASAMIAMGSLPGLMRKSVGAFPTPNKYLVADAIEAEEWREDFRFAGRRPWIGICWRSGKSGGSRNAQYAPLAAWADFLRATSGTLISVQYDATPEEVFELEKMSGRKIFLPARIDQKNELDRTCALLSALDAVVSAPTAVSWLSAAAGVPTAKIAYGASWTAFGCPYEPFAPSCQLMAPSTRGDWRQSFAKARDWLSVLPGAA